MLRLRAKLLKATRVFFDERGYTEVETPSLSSDIVVDAHLDPFEVSSPGDDQSRFLQTSPEAAMKRLLAAGSGSIFQITKSFRMGEVGRLHNPEFTMIEWYGVATSWRDQIKLTSELIRHLGKTAGDDASGDWWKQDFRLSSYEEVFEREAGTSILDKTDSQLCEAAYKLELSVDPETLSRDDLLNQILAEVIEPRLGTSAPEFLHDYPISQAALAVENPNDSRTACRFELYVDGLELCNGYEELTDPEELQSRDNSQNNKRGDRRANDLPGAKRMLAAMQSGLPQCSGVALGFDRLLMALTGKRTISDVIPFPDNIA